MSYPQPNADQYAIDGYKYFRLNTLLSSPGDIYESAQGGHAFALGPESDISRVNIAYLDDEIPITKMNQTQIDPHRSFIGLVDARNEVQYLPAGRPGRILMWSADLYDPNYQPSFAGVNDTIIHIAPRLDLIEYFSPPGPLVQRRTDKVYNFQSYVLSGSDNWIVIPTYGRKYGFVELTNNDPVDTLAFKIYGVNYGIGSTFTQEKILFSQAVAPLGGQATANNFLGFLGGGMFDAIVLNTFGDSMPLRVVLSDEP